MVENQDLSFGKMSQVHLVPTRAKTLGQSLKKSAKSKMNRCLSLNLTSGTQQEKYWEIITPLPGDNLMLSFGEYPREENASILSQILQVGVPEKYYLSPKACQGILRRASARGKELPKVLRLALERQALLF